MASFSVLINEKCSIILHLSFECARNLGEIDEYRVQICDPIFKQYI